MTRLLLRRPIPGQVLLLRAVVLLVCGTVPVAIATGPAAAQTSLFDGHWALDVERSDPPMSMGGQARDAAPAPSELELGLSGEDLAVERIFLRDGQRFPVSWVFVTDGKAHDLPGPMNSTRSARAKWKKEKLTVSYTVSRGPIEFDVIETWSLGKKGDLEIQYAARVNERMLVRKEIYTKMGPAGG